MAFQTIQQGHDVGPVANAPSTPPQIPGSTMIDHELCGPQELEVEVHSFTDKELAFAPGLTAEFMWRKRVTLITNRFLDLPLPGLLWQEIFQPLRML